MKKLLLLFCSSAFFICMLGTAGCDDEMSLAEKETALLGKWDEVPDPESMLDRHSTFEFFDNGTYEHYYRYGTYEHSYESNYYIDSDSIYTTGLWKFKYKFSHKDTLLIECVDCSPYFVLGLRSYFKYARIK